MSAENNSKKNQEEDSSIQSESNSESYSYTQSEEQKLHDYLHETGKMHLLNKDLLDDISGFNNPNMSKGKWNQKGHQFPNDLSTVPNQFYMREDMQGSPILQDKEELMHFRTVVAAFLNYRIDALKDISRAERDFNSIDKRF